MPDFTIRLVSERKPGIIATFDWLATVDGREEDLSGFGSTAAEALRSLADDLEARE